MKYSKYWLALIIFLLPLVFAPPLFNGYGLPKSILFLLGVLLGWAGLLLPRLLGSRNEDGEAIIVGNKGVLGSSLLLALVFIVSSFLQPNVSARINALSGTTAIVIGGVLLIILIKQIREKEREANETQKLFLGSITGSALVLALIAVLQSVGLLERIIRWEALTLSVWTPTGSIFTTLILIVLALVYVGRAFWRAVKGEFKIVSLIGLLATLVVLILGAIFTVVEIFELRPILIDFQAAWVVAVESFKNFTSAIFGVGPGNFRIAYARFRPIGINATEAWALYFNASFGQYLNLLTETGLLGLVAFLGIIFFVWRGIKGNGGRLVVNYPELLLGVLLIGGLFLSFDINLWLVFFVLLGLAGNNLVKIKINRYFLLTILLGLLIVVGSWYGRAVWADALFARSLAAFERGEGGNAYNWQVEVLNRNPHLDIYHLAYAQTNLALADALAQEEDLTEQDQQQITILVQQGIQAGKNAVAVNPFWFDNWVSLANIYQQIVGVAQGAEQWVIDSLNQAIALDPVSPEVRLRLGGFFFALEDFDSAQRQFELAVNLKPDHANAHYNLAATYRAQEKWAETVLVLQTVLSLTEPGSTDFDLVQQELDEARARLPQEEEPEVQDGEEVGQLQPPQPLPEPQISPINLPVEEVSPPEPVL